MACRVYKVALIVKDTWEVMVVKFEVDVRYWLNC